MQIWQALILGLLQGVSELFPISSLGHTVLLPAVLGWNIDQGDPYFLAFVIATHLATAIVLFAFYIRIWLAIFAGMLRSLRDREIRADDVNAHLGWLIVVATIPAGIVGLLFQDEVRQLFATPTVAALFLMANGAMLLVIEVFRRRAMRPEPDWPLGFGWLRALGVGAAQSFALLPGISRTGATMGGGLAAGLAHIDSARFAFLMATPIIGAAALLKLPELAVTGSASQLDTVAVGMVAAGVAAYLSVRYLDRYFRTRTLIPFGTYCLVAGALASLLLRLG
ncbi:MAG TPA: undecaprenyl-diphosphate phosphatase [Gaiellaceae bacterium]|nr:undecaprenyl-diphosphate phosphatase [Gaiellaceae bacterium]